MKIAISGYNGFIGQHLLNTLLYINNFKEENICLINRSDFNDPWKLKEKISECEIIIHLAAVNRHDNSDFIFRENIRLTKTLIDNVSVKTNTILFSSSIQQDFENSFGKAKLQCLELFKEWSKSNNKNFINLKIPNVFGPFGKPNYNSFISTFCYNIIHNLSIKCIENKVELLYIDDLVKVFIDCLQNPKNGINEISKFENVYYKSVIEVYDILKHQWFEYNYNGIIPDISGVFERNLFNTLRSFIPIEDYFPKKQIKKNDHRGFFSEIIKTNSSGQFSISLSKEGVIRGNHFHTRKIERFQVIKGKAIIELRKINTEEIITYELCSEKLEYVDIPIWYTHNVINNSDNEELIMLFWINEHYNSETHDTYPLKVRL